MVIFERGDKFVKGDCEYMLCTVCNKYNSRTEEYDGLYTLINMKTGNRFVEPVLFNEIMEVIGEKGFTWKRKVEDNPKTTLNLKCNLEIDESKVEEIVSNVMFNIMDEIKKYIKVEIN